jgi:hypothetical protein
MDIAGGNYDFTNPALLVGVTQAGSLNAASLTFPAGPATLFANSGGRYSLSGSLDQSGGGILFLTDPGTSMVALGAATLSNASISILNGAKASFAGASISGAATVSVSGGTFASTAAMTNASPVSFAGNSVGSFTDVAGAGTFFVDGTSVVTARSIRQNAVNLLSNGRIVSRADGTTAGVTRVKTLSFATLAPPGGVEQWDLTNNALVIDYIAGSSPFATIQTDIKTAYANGAWTGSGLSSSSAAASASTPHRTALGYAEASDIGVGGGTFLGQSVDTSCVLVRYTLAADSDLNGMVDLTDFTYLAANFNKSGKNWLQGDYDYDASVDLTDFTFLASNFNSVVPASLGQVVPEPLSAAAMLSLLLQTRQRRS